MCRLGQTRTRKKVMEVAMFSTSSDGVGRWSDNSGSSGLTEFHVSNSDPIGSDRRFTAVREGVNERSFLGACHPDDIERVRDVRRVGLAQEVPFALEIRLLKNEQYRRHLIQNTPLKDESGRVVRWYATAIDIDGQKKTEERV